MKRLFTILLAAIVVTLAQGQTKYENFDLGENQFLLTHFDDDKNYVEARSGNRGAVTMATRIAPEDYKSLKNCRAVGIRFALPMAVEVKNVSLHKNDRKVQYEQVPSKVAAGWNYVPFDTPQTLDTKGVFISYTYVQTDTNFGICHWMDKAPGGYWTCFGNSWNDWSDFYGALCIQLVVEADPLPDYAFVAESVDNVPVIMNEEGALTVRFVSNGRKAIDNFDYTLAIGDLSTEGAAPEVSGRVSFDTSIAAGLNQQRSAVVRTPAVDDSGVYDARLTITAINGETLAETPSTDFKASVVTRRVQRRTVVEEITGTNCGNCPRAWVGMEYLKEHLAETCIPIALHQYNADDPMFNNRYADLGFGGAAPLCQVDRKVMTDPYYGTARLGIDKDVEYYSSIAPTVDVTVSGMFSADNRKVTCSADVEWLIATGKYTVAYVITADGLKGTTAAWLQKNDYKIANAATQNILPHMQEFTQFFKDEAKGAERVSLVYNDVLIGTSYTATGGNSARSLGMSHAAGDIVNNTYTCTITAGDACKKVLDYDNIFVTAIVLDSKGLVANAARAKVVPIPEGVEAPVVDDDSPAPSYDLSGRRIAHPASAVARGITIVGGRKVIR